MAVEKIGIYPNNQNALLGASLSVMSADGTISPEFRFATQSNTWSTVNLWVTVDAVNAGGSEDVNGYHNVGASGFTGKSRTALSTPTSSGGLYYYKVPLSDSGLSTVAGYIGTVSYASRSYDAIRLKIEVRIKYTGGEVTGSATCYIGFKPTYTATAAAYTVNGLEITYTATSPWARPSDRFTTGAIKSASKALCDSGVTGKCSGAGKLVIPRSKIKRIPQTGESLTGSITMRGSWQDSNSNLGALSLSGVTVTNTTTVKVPTITATATGSGVKVKWTGTGAGSTTPTAVDVQLSGSDYVQDRWTFTAVNEEHLFDAVPAGVSTTWQAVAYVAGNDAYQPTSPVEATATSITLDGLDIVPSDGSGPIALPYNAQVSRSYSPETESVKLAGRNRPTVGFGEGGTGTWSVSGTIITDEVTRLRTDLTATDIEALAALPEKGVCVIRTEDGRRAQVYVTTCNISRAVKGIRNYSLTCEEVS